MLTVRGLQVVNTNMATYRMQKVAGSWIADDVFISHPVLRLFDAPPDCPASKFALTHP